MKITILAVGKTASEPLARLTDDYISRARRYQPVELLTVGDLRQTKSLSREQQCQREGLLLLAQLRGGDKVILLDEHGCRMTSRRFAESIQRYMLSGLQRLVFVIGGPYGFSPEVRARADAMLSVSDMTFTHEMIRLFFAEQIYRAMTILRSEPYHHD